VVGEFGTFLDVKTVLPRLCWFTNIAARG
jgi:hypothetical protein